MKTIFLHGSLNELHPEPIKVHAETAAEAVSFLKQLEGFDVENPRPIRVRGIDCRDAIYDKTLCPDELHIYPALAGAGGNGGMLQVIIGAVLFIVGIVVGVLTSWTGFGGAAGFSLAMSGAMMMLGGILMMLAPTPKTDNDTRQSLYIPSNQNTVKIGTRIKLIYGRVRTYGHFLSFNVDAKKLDDSKMNLGGYCSGRTDDKGNRYSYGQDGHCLIA
jgi:predicted phage tail protein